jgi:hypothetical protein
LSSKDALSFTALELFSTLELLIELLRNIVELFCGITFPGVTSTVYLMILDDLGV